MADATKVPTSTSMPTVAGVVDQMCKCLDACDKTLNDAQASGITKVEAVLKTIAVVTDLSQQMKISTHAHHSSNDLLKDLVSMNMVQINDRIIPMVSLDRLVRLMKKTGNTPAWIDPSADLVKVLSYTRHYFEACKIAMDETEPSENS